MTVSGYWLTNWRTARIARVAIRHLKLNLIWTYFETCEQKTGVYTHNKRSGTWTISRDTSSLYWLQCGEWRNLNVDNLFIIHEIASIPWIIKWSASIHLIKRCSNHFFEANYSVSPHMYPEGPIPRLIFLLQFHFINFFIYLHIFLRNTMTWIWINLGTNLKVLLSRPLKNFILLSSTKVHMNYIHVYET